jgi:uncharacterized SAM-binding protein YcdF (DUF218 family)
VPIPLWQLIGVERAEKDEEMNSTGPAFRKKLTSRLKPLFPVFLGVLLIAVSMAYFSLPLLGNWLVREDAVHRADAIVVLSGSFPQRALEAVDLYRGGYAPEIWLTRPVNRGAFNQFGEWQNSSEDARNLELLRCLGVPDRAIHILDTPIVNTADELNAIDSGLRETGHSSVIIVTNKAHTRRVFSLWDKYHFGEGEVLVHAVSDDAFAPSQWWKSRSSRSQGVHELLGMLDLWAGLPVHRPLQMNTSNQAQIPAALP